jgi:hypothetical protein
MVEALIDFGEGEDIEEGVLQDGLSSCLSVLFLWLNGYVQPASSPGVYV